PFAPPIPKTSRAASALIVVSGEVAGTTNAIAWIGPRYSATPELSSVKPGHDDAKMSDSPTSTVTVPPSRHGTPLPSAPKYCAGFAVDPGAGSAIVRALAVGL